ncbi:MAG TPA: valine--tRNA ligase [Acidobacteriaceae bacterium]|nr:valine--tRNA ligase [Acidobacteriaceae bacterium]
MPRELPKAYEPSAIEDRWAEYWVREELFHQASPSSAPIAPLFTTLLPPPNVTGRLHMGHMLNQTEIDILTRWRRMCGDLALWIPGTDHAGIATQMMVERQLDTEGKTRQGLGREAFVARVWEWKQHYGGAILDQMKRLGASVDWSREYFTMDAGLSAAVREAFVRLHEQGLIYRGAYIVNWCPRCQTALSDLEVVHEEQAGKLWEIRYPLADGSGFVTVATTRPETMLGDVAVAVHPEDERYLGVQGKMLRLPLTVREIPVIADSWVSPEFGTGAVKVTPAHDPNDFNLGQRHHLPSITVMDEAARMNAAAGAYAGLDRFAARKRILEDLETQGLLAAVREHTNSIGKCDRCKTIVEPRLSTQWFIRIQPLADRAIAAVEEGHIRFTPEQYAKTYFEWMRNIHDWCISRQLWWGHRIPAWHCRTCSHITVTRETPAACEECGSSAIEQETDVLDTWFSSGLLPISVFGWPAATRDLAVFYPTQLLVTGFDILFFWVARMIMLGCHFMIDMPMPDGSTRELKDAVPFREVYIHALVRDADRQKMSKTKGNVIDPIEIVQRFGTDAVRFTLAAMASPGTDIAFSEERTAGYRAFANKIWNATRFLFLQIDRAAEAGIAVDLESLPALAACPADDAPLETRWISARFNATAAEVNAALEDYRFHEAANLVYQFFWGDFCDWYLEIVKLRLDFSPEANRKTARETLTTLVAVFEAALRLLSPFMPFLTEELWHALYSGKPPAKSIALTRYPQGVQHLDDAAEGDMSVLQELIVTVRGLRKDLGVEEKLAVPAQLSRYRIPDDLRPVVQRLARVSEINPVERIAEGTSSRSTAFFDVAVVYERKIDVAAECERLAKELARLEKEAANAERQLSNGEFLKKAPAAVIEGLRSRAGELGLLIPKTRAAIENLNCGNHQ